MKIGVIDDDQVVLDMVDIVLAGMGHEVVTLPRAMGAGAWILRERPDLVLVDIGLPGLSGDEWLRMVTEDAVGAALFSQPVFVVLSGREADELEQIVDETCAVGYIRKQGGPAGFQQDFEKVVQGLET